MYLIVIEFSNGRIQTDTLRSLEEAKAWFNILEKDTRITLYKLVRKIGSLRTYELIKERMA